MLSSLQRTPSAEQPEQRPKAVLQQPAGVRPLVEVSAHEAGERLVGRVGVPPERGRGKAEGARRVGRALQLEDEKQPVDEDEPLRPELLGQRLAIWMLCERGQVAGVVEHALDEPLNGGPCLGA